MITLTDAESVLVQDALAELISIFEPDEDLANDWPIERQIEENTARKVLLDKMRGVPTFEPGDRVHFKTKPARDTRFCSSQGPWIVSTQQLTDTSFTPARAFFWLTHPDDLDKPVTQRRMRTGYADELEHTVVRIVSPDGDELWQTHRVERLTNHDNLDTATVKIVPGAFDQEYSLATYPMSWIQPI